MVDQYVAQAHERDELDELGAGAAEPDLATLPASGELETRQCVDRHGVTLDTCHVAYDGVRSVLSQQRADTVAEPAHVGTRDRAANRERDGLRHRSRHRAVDARFGRYSSALPLVGSFPQPDVDPVNEW